MTRTMALGVEVWGGIGDALCATPALQALKQQHPERELRVLCMENHLPVLAGNPAIDLLTADADDPVFADLPLLNTNYGRLMPSVTADRPAAMLIGDLLGVRVVDIRPRVGLGEEEEARARQQLAAWSRPVVLQAAAGSSRHKLWPHAYWEALVARLPDCTFLQLGEVGEAKIAGAVDLRGRTGVREAIALLKHARCFVVVDSFLNHASSAVARPGVVLFGPSTPRIWGYPTNTNLWAALPCAPCIDLLPQRGCPHRGACMGRIGVDEVAAALAARLER